ncbi:MAG: hypothetical protein ACRD88_06485 [Terriglobia bacterium]
MLFLVKVTLPVEAGNKLLRDPKWQERIQRLVRGARAKDAYFTVADGQRTMYLIVDGIESSEIPKIAEPFWLSLNASVEFIPAMSQKDFAKASRYINQAVKKY